MRMVLGWAINAGVLLLLPYMIPAVKIESFWAALLVALVIGLLNAIVRPVLVLLTLPITIVTLGLFLFVINGLLFWWAAYMLPNFSVGGFWWAVLAAFVYSALSYGIGALLLRKNA